ncbi:MAG: hypothetical protein WED05_02440 [Candidatus Atabeyarchaeum deiterrae]
MLRSVVPSLKGKVDLEAIREDGAHPEIRVNGKKVAADYNNVESLKKALLTTLDRLK